MLRAARRLPRPPRSRVLTLRRLAARAAIAIAPVLALGAIALPGEPTAALAAGTPKCTTSGLVIWLSQEGGGGALGSIYYKLELTNLSGHKCTLYGYPGVAAVTLAGRQLGVAATREPTPGKALVTLANGSSTLNSGATASALVRIIDAGVLPGCRPVAAAGLRVYPPGQTRSKVIPFPFEACSGVGRSNLTIQAVAPGALDASTAEASTQPVEMAAPYEYLGWGEPQPPASVIEVTGVHDLTLAFMLSRGRCNPEWDGERPLLGGSDQKAIEAIRAAGGEVDVSFGGWSGKKLGVSCKTPAALAGAYQKVIAAYSLAAIDIDIEHGELTNAKTRERVIQALAIVRHEDPSVEISITFGTAETGPEPDGRSLIADAAAIGFQPNAWTVMPFDFGPAHTDMGHASIRAVEGLAQDLVSAYGITTTAAYEHAGISSMNGETDESSETVSVEELRTILAFAQLHHLARFTFWAVNRDRQCSGRETPGEDCSGISQTPYAFTDVIGDY